MDLSIIHLGDIIGWKAYEEENSFFIFQDNNAALNEILFVPYFDTGVDDKTYDDTVAVFKVKKRWTNMMIADNIINNAIKNFAV